VTQCLRPGLNYDKDIGFPYLKVILQIDPHTRMEEHKKAAMINTQVIQSVETK